MCRCVEEDLVVDLGSKLKLCILNSLCVNWFEGRCWKVKEKSHRRALMMHRGGTAQRWDCTEVGLHRGGLPVFTHSHAVLPNPTMQLFDMHSEAVGCCLQCIYELLFLSASSPFQTCA